MSISIQAPAERRDVFAISGIRSAFPQGPYTGPVLRQPDVIRQLQICPRVCLSRRDIFRQLPQIFRRSEPVGVGAGSGSCKGWASAVFRCKGIRTGQDSRDHSQCQKDHHQDPGISDRIFPCFASHFFAASRLQKECVRRPSAVPMVFCLISFSLNRFAGPPITS